jgi:cysteine desulfurase
MTLYLDHNASAVPNADAAQATAQWVLEGFGNPSSVHGPGRRARAAVERARRQLAAALAVTANGIVFTSGATEALHLAIGGWVRPGDHVVVSAVEHPAVFGALKVAEAHVEVVPVDAQGRVSAEAFAVVCTPKTRLVVLMAAQNEIGNVYPVAEVAAAVAPVPLLCDGVQLFGKRAFAPQAAGCAMAVVSGHKIGAPTGVGALWRAPGFSLTPVIAGGPQERGLRGGTENVAGIIGLGAAAEAVPARVESSAATEARRDAVVAALAALEGWVRHGDPVHTLPNTVSFRLEGVDGDLLLSALDLEGVAVSSGSACSAGAVEPSSVLLALGLSAKAARGGIRVSLGPETCDADVVRFISVFTRVARRARRRDQ